MIKTVNARNFGCFRDFDWISSLRRDGNSNHFQRLNIIYGRNYSGKTTLSRIFRSLEVGRLPDHVVNPEFEVVSESGSLSQNEIDSHDLDIRVYNRDFVDEHLGFLKDNIGGEVNTFAIIGRENKKIEEQIKQTELNLGSVEESKGLRFEQAEKLTEYEERKSRLDTAAKSLDEKLRRFANDVIKRDPLLDSQLYNISAIKADVEEIRKSEFKMIDQVGVKQREDLLREQALPDINNRVAYNPNFEEIHNRARETLAREIRPSEPLQHLLNDSLLQSWVRDGMELHRNKQTACGFCGQVLPKDVWKKLDAHFNKQSIELERDLTSLVSEIESEIGSASSLASGLPERDRMYTEHRSSYENQRSRFDKVLAVYTSELSKVLDTVRKRKNNLFKSIILKNAKDVSGEIVVQIGTLNNAIQTNNNYTTSLNEKKKTARRELRLNKVAGFIQDIDLEGEESIIASLENEKRICNDEFLHLKNIVKRLEDEVETLRIQLKDEKRGADKVNEYLDHYFGHRGLKLVAVEDPIKSKYHFHIWRGTDTAYDMSEGECSLVSFCYFMARLSDIDTTGKELVVYIDDPVSSLDNNHIFFVYSLIENVIANPLRSADGLNQLHYKQLFVSTHNLEFLKYLKRLTRPGDEQGGTRYFLIENDGSNSCICLMPKYLREYQTEFIYLFHQIYKCSDKVQNQAGHETYYNFGNNLRKFLEAYLFYKYPYKEGYYAPKERLYKFFGNDSTATSLTDRLMNELSHLEQILDRSMHPVDTPVITAVANFVLNKMFEKDSEQYNALLQSIGEPVRRA